MRTFDSKIAELRNIFLRKLIGRRARHQGRLYEIVEVLMEDVPTLVLKSSDTNTIQADQHGEAHRRVPETTEVTIPLTESGSVDIEGLDLELL